MLTYLFAYSIVDFVEVDAMTDNDYSNALTAAQKELEALNNQAEIIERRRAQLQQTISSLKTLMHVAEDEERTLTDCIRIAVKGAQGYISAADVLKAVIAMGAPFSGKNMIDSVVTILSRLHKQGELLRDPNGRGYMWAGYIFTTETRAKMRAAFGRIVTPPSSDDLPVSDPSHSIHHAGPIAKVTPRDVARNPAGRKK
jgi:hypothetical protein